MTALQRGGGNDATGDFRPLADELYLQDTVSVARHLLGKYLLHDSGAGQTVGRIVETEAYLASGDPASHAFGGRTARNAVMFDEPGRAYIYFIYGMYHCLNVSTMPTGVGEAVLIRALEPVCGIPLMQARRGVERIQDLCNGPAKLVIAMGILPRYNGHDLRKPPLLLANGPIDPPASITVSNRIGIAKATDLPLRFHLAGNRFVSSRRDR